MSSLGEELPKEITRVRDEVLPEFLAIGRAGAIGAYLIRRDLDFAVTALAEGDAVNCILAYARLKETAL